MAKRKQILKNAVLLALLTGSGVGILNYLNQHARDRITYNEKSTWLQGLHEILSPAEYNNDLLNDYIQVYSLSDLGSPNAVTIYRARYNDRPVALIFSPIAPNGYSGNIKLLIGIYYNGNVAGVRVLSHKETPGLGDAIELRKSNWILGFSGRSLQNPSADNWRIKPDGGDFDAFTGATVTPRAIVKAIYKSLSFFTQNRDALFDKPAENKNR